MSNAFIPDQLDNMSTKDLLEFAQAEHEDNVKLSKRCTELESYNVRLANESHEYQQRISWLVEQINSLQAAYGRMVDEKYEEKKALKEQLAKANERIKELESYNVRLATESHEYQERCAELEKGYKTLHKLMVSGEKRGIAKAQEEMQEKLNKFALEQKCLSISELSTYFVNRANREEEMLPIWFPDWCNDFREQLRKGQE